MIPALQRKTNSKNTLIISEYRIQIKIPNYNKGRHSINWCLPFHLFLLFRIYPNYWHRAFVKCANSMLNWLPGILNSFSSAITNGFTEGCNNKIKVLKRNAYGYRNFKRFRNRILHMFSHQMQKQAIAWFILSLAHLFLLFRIYPNYWHRAFYIKVKRSIVLRQ